MPEKYFLVRIGTACKVNEHLFKVEGKKVSIDDFLSKVQQESGSMPITVPEESAKLYKESQLYEIYKVEWYTSPNCSFPSKIKEFVNADIIGLVVAESWLYRL